MKLTKKLLAIMLAFAMTVTVIPCVSVQEVQAKTGLAASKSCYQNVTTNLKLSVGKSWKNVKTTWSVKKGTGAISLIKKNVKSVKFKGEKVGTASIYAKVTYTKNGKKNTETFSCKVTVKAQGAAPKLVKVTKEVDGGALFLELTFDKPLVNIYLSSGTPRDPENYIVKVGNKTISSSDISVEQGFDSKVLCLNIYANEDYTKTVTVSIVENATLKGKNGKRIAATKTPIVATE